MYASNNIIVCIQCICMSFKAWELRRAELVKIYWRQSVSVGTYYNYSINIPWAVDSLIVLWKFWAFADEPYIEMYSPTMTSPCLARVIPTQIWWRSVMKPKCSLIHALSAWTAALLLMLWWGIDRTVEKITKSNSLPKAMIAFNPYLYCCMITLAFIDGTDSYFCLLLLLN